MHTLRVRRACIWRSMNTEQRVHACDLSYLLDQVKTFKQAMRVGRPGNTLYDRINLNAEPRVENLKILPFQSLLAKAAMSQVLVYNPLASDIDRVTQR